MLYSPVCNGFIQGRRQIPHDIIEQAKEKEKEQIIEAVNYGNKQDHYDATEVELSNYYYNQTYNK